jgi:hypothetical protein
MLPISATAVLISEFFTEVLRPDLKINNAATNTTAKPMMMKNIFLRFAFISDAGIAVSM